MLVHQIFLAFWIVARVSYERKPKTPTVVIEWYINILFAVDMARIFLTPVPNEDNIIQYNYRFIADKYLKTWLLFDIFAFLPLGMIRKNSVWEEGGKNE